MNVLVIQDDPELAQLVRLGLRAHYHVDLARTGAAGLERARAHEPDAIVLDLQLPELDGRAVCQRLREDGSRVPIIILTALADPAVTAQLLDDGADDYLVKPFHLPELQARIRAVLRRPKSGPLTSRIVIDDLVLDTVTHEVVRAGHPIKLRRKEFELLEYLLSAPGMVFTRTMILDRVWNSDEALWTNAVDVHIKNLRDRVDRPFGTHSIQTVHGYGYKFVRQP